MMLMDVNVLVYAHREDVRDHPAYRGWLEEVIGSQTAYAYSELVLSGFVRVVTHSKVFEQPSTLEEALDFAEQIRFPEHAVRLVPGNGHWSLFARCARMLEARGNTVPDAYHAALAMEWDCDWVTTDKGFKRFKGLRVRHPLR
jgi:toxin-antitoxin system PIN domain toxin